MNINLNLPPETSQDTSTVLPSAYGPMVVEASRPDSSTIIGVLGGTENRYDVLLNVVLDKNKIDTLDKTNQNYPWNILRSFNLSSLPIWIREKHINFNAIIKQTFGICTIHFLIILVWEESKQWKCPPLFLYIPHNGHGFKTIKLEFVIFSAFVILYFTTSIALLRQVW